MKTWPALASLSLHGALFAGAGWLSVQQAQFGVESGRSSVEVELVAAPAVVEETAEVAPPVPEDPPLVPAAPDLDAMVVPVPEATTQPTPALPSPPSPSTPLTHALRKTARGDGSAPTPGRDATSQRAEGGSIETTARPNYLRNPVPPYPELARRLRQEGLVRLSVRVTAGGRAESLTLLSSSGYPLLDEAALRSVRTWRFEPARVGGIPIDSTVTVPIRFELQ